MKVLLCTPYLDSPEVVSSGIGTWARSIMSHNRDTGSSIEIVPASFDRHTFNVDYATRSFQRYISGIKEVGRSLVNALRMLKAEKPDVMHICTSGSLGFIKDVILVHAARRKGVKNLVHFHFGRIPDIVKGKGYEYRLLMHLLRVSDTVVVIDGSSYQALKELHHHNVVYIPNPLTDLVLREAEALEKQVVRKAFTALFVGHVVFTKGVAELVQACCGIPGLSLRIIGKCEHDIQKRLHSMAASRENGAWLEVIGEIPHKEVVREMLQAATFVFPSYTEGFPNVILEAMACGCPIVTTSVGAIPEMLEEDKRGKYGLMVTPRNVPQLQEALATLMGNETLQEELRRNAWRRVRERYSMDTIWKQLKQLWEDLATDKC